MAAAVVLLAAAVLLHFATAHHAASAPGTASAMAPAIEPDSRKAHGHSSVSPYASTGSEHHETAIDTIARPPRTVADETQPPSAAEGTTAVAPDTSPDAPQAPGPPTARDAWSPAAAMAPTNSGLQIFRC
ncbi:hypothetical protein [Streptomyces sp. P17]|uniref:hypothetical protein n=1 Tax=Streptomyces sp. P17 TaxID=3074716 RepID=UPI0028F40CBB|nr:hypothetical protein [Streptomyces sp. P17]MDT9695151.1 hypothetical protein [Streptomyces sp. P17]